MVVHVGSHFAALITDFNRALTDGLVAEMHPLDVDFHLVLVEESLATVGAEVGFLFVVHLALVLLHDDHGREFEVTTVAREHLAAMGAFFVSR